MITGHLMDVKRLMISNSKKIYEPMYAMAELEAIWWRGRLTFKGDHF
jgi:hypothetical protein